MEKFVDFNVKIEKNPVKKTLLRILFFSIAFSYGFGRDLGRVLERFWDCFGRALDALGAYKHEDSIL